MSLFGKLGNGPSQNRGLPGKTEAFKRSSDPAARAAAHVIESMYDEAAVEKKASRRRHGMLLGVNVALLVANVACALAFEPACTITQSLGAISSSL